MKAYFSRYLISKILTAIVCSLFLFSSPYITSDTKNDSSKDIALYVEKIDKKELEGIEVRFDYSGHLREREIALRYFLDDYKDSVVFSNTKIEEIGVYLYDLDGDGKMEIFAYINGMDKCPRMGCPFAAIRALPKEIDGKDYQLIPWSMRKRANLGVYRDAFTKVLNATTLGYHNILISTISDDHNILISKTIWKWNGKYYDIGEVLDSDYIESK
jgi:hypothetical protein